MTDVLTIDISPAAATEMIIGEVWIDPARFPSWRAWWRRMAPVFEPGYEIESLGWTMPERVAEVLRDRMFRAWQRVERRRRRARKAKRGW